MHALHGAPVHRYAIFKHILNVLYKMYSISKNLIKCSVNNMQTGVSVVSVKFIARKHVRMLFEINISILTNSINLYYSS